VKLSPTFRTLAVAAVVVLPTTAGASLGPAAEGSASVEVGSSGASSETSGKATAPEDEGNGIRRHRPRRNMWEVGVSGGVFIPSRGVDLRADGQEFKQFRKVNADIALRGGYYPLRLLGVEIEGTVMPGGQTLVDEQSALFWTVRGSAVLQLPLFRIVPFATLGGGVLGVSSDPAAVGNDVDGFWAWGGGVKFNITRHIGLRFDARTNLSQKYIERDFADSEEYLLGLVVRLGPKPKPKKEEPSDRDGDGFLDPDDKCPDVPGVEPDGCPVKDTDGDGIDDPQDECPTVPGDPPTGCPPGDKDEDGFTDDVDACPEEPGVEPDGCPVRDTDGDGLLDDIDQCVEEPETQNGFEDDDGCPDEVPDEVKKFTGTIEGIFFETAKATIRAKSRPKLDEAAEVLSKYPNLEIEISGHTDARGKRDYNVDLSQRRAESVRDYLVEKGVAAERLSVRGAGSDEPRDTNKTKAGRAQNRRIEFKIAGQ
jgi:OOP family OmpA-OmpF porin